jgi:hypothetical protein
MENEDTGRIEADEQPELLTEMARANTLQFWNSFFSVANLAALPVQRDAK